MKTFKSFVASCVAILALLAGSFQPASAQIWVGGSPVSSGTWTATFTTGWTTTPTATGHWYKVGRTCTLTIPTNLPTSNATTFVITGVPAPCLSATASKTVAVGPSAITNNGITVTAPVDVLINAALTFSISGNSSGWTATGFKGIANTITVTYGLD